MMVLLIVFANVNLYDGNVFLNKILLFAPHLNNFFDCITPSGTVGHGPSPSICWTRVKEINQRFYLH